jgi:hypothetical protein
MLTNNTKQTINYLYTNEQWERYGDNEQGTFVTKAYFSLEGCYYNNTQSTLANASRLYSNIHQPFVITFGIGNYRYHQVSNFGTPSDMHRELRV